MKVMDVKVICMVMDVEDFLMRIELDFFITVGILAFINRCICLDKKYTSRVHHFASLPLNETPTDDGGEKDISG